MKPRAPLTVLVVDDEPRSLETLRRTLESLAAEQSSIRAVYGVGYRWEADACRIV